MLSCGGILIIDCAQKRGPKPSCFRHGSGCNRCRDALELFNGIGVYNAFTYTVDSSSAPRVEPAGTAPACRISTRFRVSGGLSQMSIHARVSRRYVDQYCRAKDLSIWLLCQDLVCKLQHLLEKCTSKSMRLIDTHTRCLPPFDRECCLSAFPSINA